MMRLIYIAMFLLVFSVFAFADTYTTHRDTINVYGQDAGLDNNPPTLVSTSSVLSMGHSVTPDYFHALFQDIHGMDSLAILAGAQTLTFDSIICNVVLSTVGSGGDVAAYWFDLKSVDEFWDEEVSDSATSWQYRDSTGGNEVAWTTAGGQFTLVQDSILKFSNTQFGTTDDSAHSYFPDGSTEYDKNNFASGQALAIKLPTNLIQDMYEGNNYGWAITPRDTTGTWCFGRFTGSENSTSSNRWSITYYYTLTAPASTSGRRRRQEAN